ncbi:MAG: molybdopterin-dependent oxidoreductase [Dehalococcoidia bacterium]|nr:molybdopterin-dependent oxidoreductase [Dehalococcoidia bacterium]
MNLLWDVRPLPSAKCVGVAAGGFVTWLELDRLEGARALLAYELGGEPIPWEHGGPLRLILEDGLCYQSVKWVDRLVLASEAGVETAEHIAMDRLQS